jgi:hypothetical protein
MRAEAGPAKGSELAEVDPRAFYSDGSSGGKAERLPDSAAELKGIGTRLGVPCPNQGLRFAAVQTPAPLNQMDVTRPEAVVTTDPLSTIWDPSDFRLQPSSVDAPALSWMTRESFTESRGVSEQASYPADPLPMDWQTWDEIAEMVSFWI